MKTKSAGDPAARCAPRIVPGAPRGRHPRAGGGFGRRPAAPGGDRKPTAAAQSSAEEMEARRRVLGPHRSMEGFSTLQGSVEDWNWLSCWSQLQLSLCSPTPSALYLRRQYLATIGAQLKLYWKKHATLTRPSEVARTTIPSVPRGQPSSAPVVPGTPGRGRAASRTPRSEPRSLAGSRVRRSFPGGTAAAASAMLRGPGRALGPALQASWARWSGSRAGVPARVVDLRSDTVTRPGPAMRRAMAEAAVGDDDYGEDPTVRELQEKTAELLGVERTLFVPTNTMANLISVMGHCRRRGSQLLLGQESHLHVYEQGLVAQIAGVHSHPLPDLPHGTLDLEELERAITRGLGSPYHPVCELVCLEDTHNSAGGRALPIDYLRQVGPPPPPPPPPPCLPCTAWRGGHGARVHLDGARLMNAAVALRVPPARIVEHCDSVSFCFSKGLGAPVGAVLGGPKDFIEEAWRLRKTLGGGMHQSGVLAAAALAGLAGAEEALRRDHSNARRFAQGLQALASPICSVDPAAVETNIVLVRVHGLPAARLCQRLQAVSAHEAAQTGQAVRVLLLPWTERAVRAVWHRDVSARDTELALRKWELVLRQLGSGGGDREAGAPAGAEWAAPLA
ncbi:LOW QUALITY PROTEIN: probable low-specificity L-threonine aldolase 2 [Perognathus longimembris pacificus]|uniref:LOW QUALITY PROTEIN: probable low-specificity L-threonine aldolase 2 n=1 Tax=Perognathus longimembris pacificus TaxID=214514 RepID=UPI002018C8C9|nr:LOW QUALITY PROTEIN: probable low-specificity L-threonine aldolase 2 [Perognathus longimembris pacificus]